MLRHPDEAIKKVSEVLNPLVAQHLAHVEKILRLNGASEIEILCVLAERRAELAEWYVAALAAAERDITGIGSN